MKFYTLISKNNDSVFGTIEVYTEDQHTIVEITDSEIPILFKSLSLDHLESFINVGDLNLYKIKEVEI